MATIGYVRVSTKRQEREGDGLDVQRKKIAAWCEYEGVTLDALEQDVRSGGSTDGRAGFRRAIRSVLEAGPGSVLVVYALDRLGRSALDVQETLAVLLDGGVRVVSLKDGVDSGSGMGAGMLRLLTNILATFAEMEKERIRDRLYDGRLRARDARRVYSKEARLGLAHGDAVETDGKKIRPLVVADAEVQAVERIGALHAEGKSIREIVAVLDAEGLKPRRGKAWSTAVVHRIVSGRRAPEKKKSSERIRRARAALLADVMPEAAE